MTAELSDVDRALLERAIDLARAALQEGGNPFGAVLAHDGAVLAEGRNEVAATGDPTRHAELVAISAAAPRLGADVLAASTLYSSTEPCEMCSGATVRAGIGRVVFACAGAVAAEIGMRPSTLPTAEVLAAMGSGIELVGPALPEAGRAVHEADRERRAGGG